MALKLLLACAAILMASACGPSISIMGTFTAGRPVPLATALVSPDRTLEANLAQDQPQTTCDSPYLPLRNGATWTYHTRRPHGDLPSSDVTGMLVKMFGREARVLIPDSAVLLTPVMPNVSTDYVAPGSTDVGDVSWVMPTGQIQTTPYVCPIPDGVRPF